MDQNIQKILEIKNKKMQKAFNQNHIELLFLDNKQELLNYLDSLLKDDQTVGVGGSMTLLETGVINYLRNKISDPEIICCMENDVISQASPKDKYVVIRYTL